MVIDAAAPLTIISVFVLVLVLTVAATGLLLPQLRRRAILDRPNERSSHDAPTPRGGGLAVVGVLLLSFLAIFAGHAAEGGLLAVVAAAAVLAAVSWRDDLAGLSPALRLVVQALAVAAGLAVLPGAGEVFQGLLPRWLDLLVSGLLWLWFVNLYNFMDGIDGITGVETGCVGAGIALTAFLFPGAGAAGASLLGAAVAGAGFGFLAWNWHKAKIFLGDVGSVPLGYLIGWLLLSLATTTFWATALVLPLYYLADATWTLLRRLARGERIWQAHREHAYQRAVQRGLSHAAVAQRILLGDLVLVATAILASDEWFVPSLAIAAATVALLIFALTRRRLPRRGVFGGTAPPLERRNGQG
jgi:UDP-N-acetylmuramyl pentapeptide phosphotransferase/UDP-N-acetylglucosamine-1-phosphate transferase